MVSYSYTGSIALYTVATAGTYKITAYGGQGGSNSAHLNPPTTPLKIVTYYGGLGAEVGGDFVLTAGEVIEIVVGGQGGNGRYPGSGGGGGGGGGGGSFVFELSGNNSLTKLVIAGGGGGGGNIGNGGGGNAQGAGSDGGGQSYSVGGSGGTGGARGGGGDSGAGSGSGVNGAGGSAGSPLSGFGGYGGSGFIGGAGGGRGFAVGNANGAFGGGGGASGDGSGGGGGGYSGGGGGGNGFSGGGGGSYLSSDAIARVLVSAEHSGAGLVTIIEEPTCYLRGTHILTPTGEVFIENLKIGDAVVTRFNGIQPVRWIGRRSYDARFSQDDHAKLPVCIRAGALGQRLPARDLYISPGHSMLIDGHLILAHTLVNGVTITQDWSPTEIHYFHVELETHDCIIAEGAWSETFADGPGLRDGYHNAAEFAALYPDYPPVEEHILCAPRPARGAKLGAVLRGVMGRLSILEPGPLHGFIDRVAAPWTIAGWAHDADHPELPVLLELVVQNRMIGTVLACDFRDDLAQAGFGRGRCAFSVTSPVRLTPESAASVRLRRAADHVGIEMTPECMDAIAAARQPAEAPRLRLVG